MTKVKITFPDGSVSEFDKGVSAFDVAMSISEGLARNSVAAMVNGKAVDISTTLNTDCELKILTFKDEEGKDIFWHSASHLMTQAILRLFKGQNIGLGVGVAVTDGFYQDYDLEEPLRPDDLVKIEEEMKKIVKEKLKITQKDIPKAEALEFYKNDPYKIELANAIPEDVVSMYSQGEYDNLCKGPHVPNTGMIKAFKLTKIAGAYWRGDSKNKQLQRIYGVAFPDKKELKEYVRLREEAEKRDHNKLGRKLDLFTTSEVIGKGLPLLCPKGATIKRILRRFIEDEEYKRGYIPTETPVMAKSDLYKMSGHYDHYKDSMFVFESGGEEFCLRPMTCPHQFMIYKSKMRSYRDLPLRYAEVADLFRNEQSGELHGLIRVRQFTLADAHIICRPDQLENEFKRVVELIQYLMSVLGLTGYWYRFSKCSTDGSGKYIDNPEAWANSQKIMKKIVDELDIEYVEADNEAAFYGPKLDVQMKNVYGKEDTLFTVQIDFALPERFDMTYEGEDGKKHRPMVIHRASIGCLERTMALLIEQYAGKFPLWLSPVQVKILPIADRHAEYCEKIKKQMFEQGIRVELDSRSESIKKKVREAQLEYVNYILVVGDSESENGTVNVRTRDNEVHGEKKVDKFISEVCAEIMERR
ncbi:threonine--tRNA ligase [Candidatus Woesearchaeota archaeon]|nr:threonine--tRNA ligase [Candidatus Woesearchaeota archaeon]MBT3538346.1 threonine--tRNA ligase [Candidatus Woesearchaeota archaeon]MBT4698323.1 threonine--tRNA ligase [Candidatus Woesearchaeota archaeon]MBT4716778.1 threonine--tRNA ligase [Candidatus Woesearchaeota archaeon]MBT7106015.1 threonine--tRNA ligase [Candidatus Woesearchaeota archaeon]